MKIQRSKSMRIKCLNRRRRNLLTSITLNYEQQQQQQAFVCLDKTFWIVMLISILIISLNHLPSLCLALVQVPNRHTLASIPGDLVIGILVPVHERPEPKQAQTGTCGTVREQYGIQRVEAAFRTIDSINADPTILPNITLGLEIRDSCWHSPIALEQSIEFIRDAMAASEQNQLKMAPSPTLSSQVLMQQQHHSLGLSVSATGTGSAHQQQQQQQNEGANLVALNANASSICAPLLLRQQQQQLQQQTKKVKNVVGVVGPASSGDTVQVQNLLQMFSMPQVGYSATSRDLSNKNFYKYFLRVVPSDKLQARVLIDLMLAHNWTYITVAYTEGSYGASLMNAFRERAQEVGICFATLESMPPNADDAKFDELIEAIQKHPNARVVICMCEGRTVSKLFSGFKRKNIINEYLVVGSDGWSDRFDVVERREDFALGGISIRIHSAYVYDFDDHYFALNPFTNHRNPWFAEFWETRFQCNLDTAAATAQNHSQTALGHQQQRLSQQQNQQRFGGRTPGSKVYNRTCTGRESLRTNHKQDAKMAFVQKSIITMALGLDSMQRAICPPNKTGLCPEMLPVNGSTLIQHLMNVSFSFLGEEVYFDEQGDPPGKYEILNFQRRRPQQTLGSSLDQKHRFGHYDASSSITSGSRQDPSSSLESDVFGSDYSIASVAGNISESTLAEKKRLNPLYDSYSTLRVYRPTSAFAATTTSSSSSSSSGGGSSGAIQAKISGRSRIVERTTLRQQRQAQHPPASGYSSTSGYEYVHVGSWKSSDGLSLFGEIQWPSSGLTSDDFYAGGFSSQDSSGRQQESGAGSRGSLPKSVCSLPCAKGHAKKIQSDSVKCCWVCVPCRPNEYLFNETKCKACEKGWWPNSVQTDCDQIPIQYFDWRSVDALTAISIAIFGLILTLATAIVFVRHNNTPVVKSTTRELSYMILFAMFLCYLNTFFLVAKPSKLTCFVTRILPGFAFAMMYGALVTKTNRIARILAGSKKKIITRRPRFMSATSQVAITWIIVCIECLIIVFMLIREPADKMHDYPSDMRVVLVCNTTTMGIIAMCTLYAFKTRNVPENFNEAKFIGFTMYTTLVIWIAFVAIYLSSDHKVTTLCLCISFSALFALLLLFFPRCYIIIFKPEKNNRSFFTTTKNVRCHIGYQIGSAGAAAAAAAASAAQLHNSASGNSSSNNNNNNNHHQITFQGGSNSTCTTGSVNNTLNGHQHYYNNQQHYLPAQTNSLDSDQSVSYETGISSKQQNNNWPQQTDSKARKRTSGLDQTRTNAATTTTTRQQSLDPRLSQHSGISDSFSLSTTKFQPDLVVRSSQWNNNSSRVSDPTATNESSSPAERQQQQHLALSQSKASAAGMQQQNQRTAQVVGGSGEPSTATNYAVSLLERFFLVLANRSRRKESDKASSIQQHLRAIRHAENLDRQTHFRRSQVQKSLQRFDSSVQMEPNSMVAAAVNRYQVGGVLCSKAATNNSMLSDQLLAASGGQWRKEDGERLLSVLSQLIGPTNVLRLADKLKRHCQQQQKQDFNEDSQQKENNLRQELVLSASNASNMSSQQQQQQQEQRETMKLCMDNDEDLVLDLNRLTHRRLAFSLLSFLGEMVRRSMEEISQISCDSRSLVSRPLLTEEETGRAKPMANDTTTTTTTATGQEDGSSFGLEKEGERRWNNGGQIVCKSTSATIQQRSLPSSSAAADHKSSMSSSQMPKDYANNKINKINKGTKQANPLDESQTLETGSRIHHEEETTTTSSRIEVEMEEERDPIKRALDNIMGRELGVEQFTPSKKQLSGVASRVVTATTQRNNPDISRVSHALAATTTLNVPNAFISATTSATSANVPSKSTTNSHSSNSRRQRNQQQQQQHSNCNGKSACEKHVCCSSGALQPLDCCSEHSKQFPSELCCCQCSIAGNSSRPAAVSALQMTSLKGRICGSSSVVAVATAATAAELHEGGSNTRLQQVMVEAEQEVEEGGDMDCERIKPNHHDEAAGLLMTEAKEDKIMLESKSISSATFIGAPTDGVRGIVEGGKGKQVESLPEQRPHKHHEPPSSSTISSSTTTAKGHTNKRASLMNDIEPVMTSPQLADPISLLIQSVDPQVQEPLNSLTNAVNNKQQHSKPHHHHHHRHHRCAKRLRTRPIGSQKVYCSSDTMQTSAAATDCGAIMSQLQQANCSAQLDQCCRFGCTTTSRRSSSSSRSRSRTRVYVADGAGIGSASDTKAAAHNKYYEENNSGGETCDAKL